MNPKEKLEENIYELVKKVPYIKWRELGRKLNISHDTAQKYYYNYVKRTEKENIKKFVKNLSRKEKNHRKKLKILAKQGKSLLDKKKCQFCNEFFYRKDISKFDKRTRCNKHKCYLSQIKVKRKNEIKLHKCRYCKNIFSIPKRRVYCSNECYKKYENEIYRKKIQKRLNKLNRSYKQKESYKQHIKKYAREYYKRPEVKKKHKERCKINNLRRLTKLRDSFPLITKEQIKLIIKRDISCVYCNSPENLTFDHIIPLNKNGKTSYNNLVRACLKCNSSKNDKDVFNWCNEKNIEIPEIIIKLLSHKLQQINLSVY